MITFSISFPSMLRRIIGQKILSELYTSLSSYKTKAADAEWKIEFFK